MSTRPKIDTTTVEPAKTTARPAVPPASTTASRGSRPSASADR